MKILLILFILFLVSFPSFPKEKECDPTQYLFFSIFRLKKDVGFWAGEMFLEDIYRPCFFWNSRSSFQRVFTPSIMTWTSWTSE